MTGYDVEYAQSSGGHIAFGITGSGDEDVLVFGGGLVGFSSYFDDPGHLRFLERLGRFARVLLMDPRGIGMSDPIDPNAPLTVDDLVDDMLAIVDAARVERVVLVGMTAGVPIGLTFASRYPERVTALVLMHGMARTLWASDYPIGAADDIRTVLGDMQDTAQPRDGVAVVAPSRVDDPEFRRWFNSAGRRGASPATAAVYRDLLVSVDVRHVLGSVAAPTLVLHRTDNAFLPPAFGRYIADHVPGARFVALPGTDQMLGAGDVDVVADEIEEFVTGQRTEREPDRVLATLVFTDLVDSTKQSAALGDQEWRRRLSSHDAAVRRIIPRYGGREIKTMGDGFLIMFTSPAQAIRAATEIRAAVGELGLGVRCGLHTGETEVLGDDVGGIAVAIAARVMALAGPGEVLVSGAVPPLVTGSLLQFEDRGEHDLKGVPGRWRVYACG
jgi:class 3 adenylate cyclase